MAQASISQDSVQITNNGNTGYTTSATQLKYRTINNGSPISHNDVDANFEIIRKAINGIISDIDGVVDKDVAVNVPAGALFTDTTYTTATNTTLGLVKIGASGLASKNYPVQLNTDGQMYVSVPWVDTNTNTVTTVGTSTTNGSSGAIVLSAGSNISLSKSSNTITISSSGGSTAVQKTWSPTFTLNTLINVGSTNTHAGGSIERSEFYYYRVGRMAILSGYITFYSTSTRYTKSTYSSNLFSVRMKTPTDTLVSGGTANIYPKTDPASSFVKYHHMGTNSCVWQGKYNSQSGSSMRINGYAHVSHDFPGMVFLPSYQDELSLIMPTPPEWGTTQASIYVYSVGFEVQFLLSDDFA